MAHAMESAAPPPAGDDRHLRVHAPSSIRRFHPHHARLFIAVADIAHARDVPDFDGDVCAAQLQGGKNRGGGIRRGIFELGRGDTAFFSKTVETDAQIQWHIILAMVRKSQGDHHDHSITVENRSDSRPHDDIFLHRLRSALYALA